MQLTLILPGILESRCAVAQRRFKRLETWLTRSLSVAGHKRCYEQALLDALGYPVPAYAQLPAAQCTWLADFDESAPMHCSRADPVHLIADKDHARLVPSENLQLTLPESQDLTESLNTHFAQDHIRFSIGQKGRWYVSGEQTAAPDTAPTSQVAGRNIEPFLPNTPETLRWRQIATEAQMLLHTHPVNQSREQRGLLAVNGLWFWGAGKMPAQKSVRECKVFSDTAFAVGAGQLSGLRVYPLQEVMGGLPGSVLKRSGSGASNQCCIIILDTRLLENILIADNQAQLDHLQALQQGLFAAIDRMLLRGQISKFTLDPCDGQHFDLSRRDFFRFWKRSG